MAAPSYGTPDSRLADDLVGYLRTVAKPFRACFWPLGPDAYLPTWDLEQNEVRAW
ncbi:hypothetical protein SCARD494_04636 [Seiridium cardinale]